MSPNEPNQKTQNRKGLATLIGTVAAGILIGVGGDLGFTEQHEGMVFKGYRDPVGIPTKCAGDTSNVVVGKVYTEAECLQSLQDSLLKHAEPVVKCAPYLKDKPYALAMAVDLNYNVGLYCNTSIDKAFRAGHYAEACKLFNEGPDGKPRWVFVKDKFDKATGRWSYKTLPGLVKRAADRRRVCMMGA